MQYTIQVLHIKYKTVMAYKAAFKKSTIKVL